MSITINGITLEGSNISIIDGVIIIDGDVQDLKIHGVSGISKSSPIYVTGDVSHIDCVNCTVHGNVTGDIDATNVTCGNVGGDIDAVNVTRK